LASLPKPKAPPPAPSQAKSAVKVEAPRLSKEEEALRDKWRRLLEMVQKGRLDALSAFWLRESESLGGVNARIPEWTGEKCATLLQFAARSGQVDVTLWLLENQHADPSIPIDVDHDAELDGGVESDSSATPLPSGRKAAYDIAASRTVRDVFRRCAGAHPDWWDWHGAGRVPSALTKEMEDERGDKRKARRKGLKEKLKEREAREKEQDVRLATPEPPKTTAKPQDVIGPRRLGGANGSGEGIAGLSEEMRAKVERERRARAAEARLKALSSRDQ